MYLLSACFWGFLDEEIEWESILFWNKNLLYFDADVRE